MANCLYEMCLQGIMVVMSIKRQTDYHTPKQSKIANGQDLPAFNHGSCVHQNKHPVQE